MFDNISQDKKQGGDQDEQTPNTHPDNGKPQEGITIGPANNSGQADTAGIAPDTGGDLSNAQSAAAMDNNAGKKNTEAAASGGAIQDIFAETEKPSRDGFPEKPEAFQAKDDNKTPEQKPALEAIKRAGRKKLLILFAMLGGLIILGAGGFWGYKNFAGNFFSDFLKETEIKEENNEKIDTEIINDAEIINKDNEPEIKQETPKTINIKNPDDKITAPDRPMDRDQDGLSDEEEKILGTNINNVDSDGDGLFDREEIKIYSTDPLNPDTDGDSFLDGAEVKAGYNPRGTGKLYEIK